MKLTVLGSGTSVPHPRRSSSAHWVETEGGTLMLDFSGPALHRMAERWDGLKSFLKLLAIPLLMAQFQRSGHGRWVACGFLASCAVLLALSWLLALVPGVPWPWRGKGPIGVPIKDYIAQSVELATCAAMRPCASASAK